jgi:hypothetical protein
MKKLKRQELAGDNAGQPNKKNLALGYLNWDLSQVKVGCGTFLLLDRLFGQLINSLIENCT